MAAYTLQLEGHASQEFRTTLNGQTVHIRVSWHDISQSWFLDMYQANGTPILQGRRLSTNTNAFADVLTNFQGTLTPESFVTPIQELTRNAWTETHKLVYDDGRDS